MKIFIDESGSFVNSSTVDSWNCVVAYVMPERDTTKSRKILSALKSKATSSSGGEVKLNDVSENDYFRFLSDLGGLNSILFSVATDAGRNRPEDISLHQKDQVEKIRKNVPRMKYEAGKQAIQILSDQLGSLSPQLYVQLHCQVNLIFDIVSRTILYFVQRDPKTLRRFKWRIDQKNTTKIDFEEAFEKITPPLLQSKSINEPLMMIQGADYSALAPYEYTEGEALTYLKDEFGVDITNGINIGKLVRENLEFEDSKRSEGIQIADLLASGLRRCLRNEFNKNQVAAQLLGRLMLRGQHEAPPLRLIGFDEYALPGNNAAASAVNSMIRHSRSMLVSKLTSGLRRTPQGGVA